jgi:predicted small lipoprotein YifL
MTQRGGGEAEQNRLVLLSLALTACGSDGEREQPESRKAPLPAQTRIGAEDVEPPPVGWWIPARYRRTHRTPASCRSRAQGSVGKTRLGD